MENEVRSKKLKLCGRCKLVGTLCGVALSMVGVGNCTYGIYSPKKTERNASPAVKEAIRIEKEFGYMPLRSIVTNPYMNEKVRRYKGLFDEGITVSELNDYDYGVGGLPHAPVGLLLLAGGGMVASFSRGIFDRIEKNLGRKDD
ncbi:hypothetical protein HY450_01995 [Candidatus Pacearchaeota archaeon]|nr:hypothetical protein [Candidatus Pacearchaeota archaeon]